MEYIDHQRTSLLPNTLNTLKTIISNSDCISLIEKQNDHYLAVDPRDLENLARLLEQMK